LLIVVDSALRHLPGLTLGIGPLAHEHLVLMVEQHSDTASIAAARLGHGFDP
jgi:hypothetical protein